MEHNVLIDFVVWTFASWGNFLKVLCLLVISRRSVRVEHKS